MSKNSRITIEQIKAFKGAEKPLVVLTAYTAPMAKILDPVCEITLVGDSIGMVMYGMDNTLGVTMEMMIAHGKAVSNNTQKACVVIDMPYGSYEDNKEAALTNAKRMMDETGCDAVKLEGGQDMADTISYLVENGAPVMGHIGLQPQSVVKDGGFRVKGKSDAETERLLKDAKAVEKAGAFSVVIEGTVEPVAKLLTESISIPTIGIGASLACDGQVLVTEDMLGLSGEHVPKFVKQYVNLSDDVTKAVKSFADDVRKRTFPAAEHVYTKKAG
ncbi:MAG: 3-methyl-2-oxobutanoate hydroxymethyltransferase [Alphaproteobacteria bacterium]|nr:3-methyl-2-oxobutanoate hydroxymethyltransferase [Alphaproteobacteria bacterium]